MIQGYDFELLRGAELESCVDDVAALRIEVFREYPYLYDGDADYERKYLRVLSQSERGLIVLVRHGSEVVGASTALPLVDADEAFQEPFERPCDYYYFGESVLLAPHRGQGIGGAFFHFREEFALKEGFARACFCAVRRPENHPSRPDRYRDLGHFWKSRGFQKTELTTKYPWKDVGDSEETEKVMEFWEKRF